MVYFDPSLPIGISCDASSVGVGAVLFYRYPDGSERPISNVSKTLTTSQRNYSQVQKEALAFVFALKKFFQYLFGRKFILITDHKPLLALFGPDKPTPSLAANRLARWALFLSQLEYVIEYRKTSDHMNVDCLSRLPVGDDPDFDREETVDDIDVVCAIERLSKQVKTRDAAALRKETAKDSVLSTVLRYTREGWPPTRQENNPAEKFRKISESLSIGEGCLLYGSRVVIPASLHRKHFHYCMKDISARNA